MATATAKSTLGNIFGMVGTTAGAVTSAIEAGVIGVEMLDRFVQKHSDNQRVQYVLEAGAYKINLLKEMALDQSRREQEVIKFCAESPAHKAEYDSNLLFFTKILEDSEANRT